MKTLRGRERESKNEIFLKMRWWESKYEIKKKKKWDDDDDDVDNNDNSDFVDNADKR